MNIVRGYLALGSLYALCFSLSPFRVCVPACVRVYPCPRARARVCVDLSVCMCCCALLCVAVCGCTYVSRTMPSTTTGRLCLADLHADTEYQVLLLIATVCIQYVPSFPFERNWHLTNTCIRAGCGQSAQFVWLERTQRAFGRLHRRILAF